MLGAATQGVDWATVGAVAVPIIGGALAMAWKLGGLERAVKDLGERVKRLESTVSRFRDRS